MGIDKELIHDLLVEEIGVIPVKKNKAPALPKGHNFLYERMNLEDIDRYFPTNTYGIGIPCGGVSSGTEMLDFDDHDGKHGIEKVFRGFCSNPFVRSLIDQNKVYVQKTPSGGFHLVYRYISESYEGNRKLAKWEDQEVMIETRGNGGYFVTYPTMGYERLYNNYFDLRSIEKDDRDLLIKLAISLNKYNPPDDESGTKGSDKTYKPFDPVSFYNYNKSAHARNVLRENGWQCKKPDDEIQKWIRPGKTDGVGATWGNKENMFFVFTSNGQPFKTNVYYSPFEILCILKFKKDWKGAINWIMSKYFSDKIPYVRIGTNYFKKIYKKDRFEIKREELKTWTKDEIKTDFGAPYLKNIPQFDDFIIEPNNQHYKPVVDSCYNLYKPFPHKSKEGVIKWSKIIMEHIFGSQYEIGLKYIQSLYLNPKKALPVLVLVSKQRSTGKTTFLNWLNMVFGENMVIVDPQDITNSFNSIYATSNIIAIEETVIEKRHAIEKIKALSTGKFISVNQKYIANYKVPFYGHIIMTSNEKDNFINIDDEEIRFFIRELSKPKFENYNIEDDLVNEIPAFLHYLESLPELDYTKSRALFTPEELGNDNLETVKRESKTWLYEELTMIIDEVFYNYSAMTSFYATASDIKNRWFANNNQISLRFIRKVLVNEFKMDKVDVAIRYEPFADVSIMSKNKVGKAYLFIKEDRLKLPEK